MSTAILNAILTNVKKSAMTFVSYTGIGDGSKVFNKGAGKNAMLEVCGHEHTDIVMETKNTVLVGGNYADMQNNRIKKSIKRLLTEVQLAGGNALAEGILEGILPKTAKNDDGEARAFESQGLPWGEWLEGWEGILLTHKGETYLRVYDEANVKTDHKYFLEGKEFDIDNPKYAKYRKPAKKASGKVSELKEALSKVIDLENEDIKDALEKLKPIQPQTVTISKMKNFTINGKTYN